MTGICAVVLDYFGADKTERCLQSLMGQGISEARVVDNSGDARYQELLSQKMRALAVSADFRVRYVASDENLGFGRAINGALRLPSGGEHFDCYLVINNDAYAEPGMVDALVCALRDNPRIGVVAPCTCVGNSLSCGSWYQRQTGLITKRRLPGSFHYLTGACLLIDAGVLGSRLFDESFFMYGEDVELDWRLRRQGYLPQCRPEAAVRHSGGGSSRQGALFYEYHVLRGHVLLALRLSRTVAEIPVLLLGRFVVLTVRAVVRCVRLRSPWPVVALALAWWPLNVGVRPRKSI